MTTPLFRLVILGCLATCAWAQPHTDRPNIILMMGDDHGWAETGYNGHPYLQTPVLDEMAATGLRFDRFYSSGATCSPTRASFLTGRHANRMGTFSPNWSMRPEEITLGHLAQQVGYRTAHFGKWHVGAIKAESPLSPGAMGFDEWLSHDNFFELDPVLSRNGTDPEVYPGESSEILIDETIRFADRAQQEGKPFLILVWFGSPHEPYMPLEDDLALYEDLPDKWGDKQVRLTSLETGTATHRPVRDVLQERYAEITAMDRAIGKLRTHLSKVGLRDNTIILYCGDNGIPSSGNFESPLRGAKGDVYDGGILVPGVLEWPAAIGTPRSTSFNASTGDLLATVADLAGADLPDRPIDGISLAPLFHGSVTERTEPIFFWEFDGRTVQNRGGEPYVDPSLQEGTTPLVKMMDGKYTRTFRNLKHPIIRESDYGGELAVLDGSFKLVVNGEGDSSLELFDVSRDPYETTNLVEQKPELAASMREQLQRWQNSVLHSLTGGDY